MGKRPHNPAIDAMIDSFDGGDPWGSAMAMAFAVAEVSRAKGLTEPGAILEYRPSPIAGSVTLSQLAGGTTDSGYEAEMLADAVIQGDVSDEDLTIAARVLHKYLHLCKTAGLDY